MTVMLPKDLQNSLRDKILKLTADHKVRLASFYLLLFGLPNLLAFLIGSGPGDHEGVGQAIFIVVMIPLWNLIGLVVSLLLTPVVRLFAPNVRTRIHVIASLLIPICAAAVNWFLIWLKKEIL